MRHLLAEQATQRPRLIYLLVLLLTVVLASQLPRIQVDTDPENMLADDQADRVFHNEVERTFGLHDAIVVGLLAPEGDDASGVYTPDVLAATHALTEGILAIEGVVRPDVLSLATVDNITQEGPGTIRFEWLMAEPPEDAAAAAAIRRAVERLPLFVDTLVSSDGRATALYVPIESKDQSFRIAGEIRALADALETAAEVYITGLPVAEDTFGHEMFVQMGISAPLAAAVIFALMWLFFRNVRLVTAPMIVALATVLSTMGLLVGLGFTVHIMSSMIPIFLMPIAVVDSIHILSEFADRYRPGSDRRAVVTEVVGHLFRPMLFTSVTSAVGFASLALTPIPPVQVFGVFVAFGILLAFTVTIVFVPAYVVRMPATSLERMQAVLHAGGADSALARAVRGLGRFAVARGAAILALTAVVFAVSLVGIGRIEINDNPVRWFKADHRIRVADRVLNEHFAGTYDAYYVLEAPPADETLADVVDALQDARARVQDTAALDAVAAALAREAAPASDRLREAATRLDDALWSAAGSDELVLGELLTTIEAAQEALKHFLEPRALAEIDRLQAALLDSGRVGKTSAVTDLVKTVYRELASGEPRDYRVPDSLAGVSQALLQFQSSHRPQDLWRLVTPDYRRAVIWLQLESGDNQDMSAVMAHLDTTLAAEPLAAGLSGRWAGKTYINVVWQDAMVRGMVSSLLGAFVVVLLMMVVLFRSVVFGLLAMLPLTVTITFIYGLIGWLGKDYDMPIAVLSALTLGLSVDFAIHFLERSRALYAESGSLSATMAAMFEEPGRAITRNAIVIAVGFLPLLAAPLVPYITVGFFLAAIMAVSGAVTLLVLPAAGRGLRRWTYPETGAPTAEPAPRH